MCAMPYAVPRMIFTLEVQSNGVFSATPLIPCNIADTLPVSI
uniref:Uncharacterized protein n=1 Tax=Arundo donax TaxID=35708 RepID=A0A0A9G7R2_ARUDO